MRCEICGKIQAFLYAMHVGRKKEQKKICYDCYHAEMEKAYAVYER